MPDIKQMTVAGDVVEAPAGWDVEFTLAGIRIREKTETKRAYRALYLGWKFSAPPDITAKDKFDPLKETINRTRIGPKASTSIEPGVREKFVFLIEDQPEIENNDLQAGIDEYEMHTWRTPKAEIKIKEEKLAKMVEDWNGDHIKFAGKVKAYVQRGMKVLKDEVMNGGDWDLHSGVLLMNLMDHIRARLNQNVIDGDGPMDRLYNKKLAELKRKGIDVQGLADKIDKLGVTKEAIALVEKMNRNKDAIDDGADAED